MVPRFEEMCPKAGWKKSAFYLLSIFTVIDNADAILCRSCYRRGKEAECHMTITCTESDMCYTQVDKYYNFGKRYIKGCMNKETCVSLQELNDKRYCSWMPSSCIYCCDDKDHCNAFNMSASIRHYWLIYVYLYGAATIYLATVHS